MSENKPRRRAQAARAAKKSASRKSGLSRVMLVAMMMVMVAVVSIGGTLAWLQANTDPIVNTFTSSDIKIALEETDADNDNNKQANSYKMVPGGTITKDPKATVLTDSEACWLFVKVDRSTDPSYNDYMVAPAYADGWKVLTEEKVSDEPEAEVKSQVIYRAVSAEQVGTPYPVLAGDQLKVKDTVTKAMMEAITGEGKAQPTLTLTAYAIQSANLTGVTADTTEADAAAIAWGLIENK